LSVPRRLRGEPCRAAHLTACGEDGRELTYGFCDWDWDRLPEDLRARIEWADEEGSPSDRAAAYRSALQDIEEQIAAERQENTV
jgi:hypothetical protein